MPDGFAQSSKATLACDPTFALGLAILYEGLGGGFCVSSDGRRGYYQPHPDTDEIPQPFPDADPDERFHSTEEWEGAIKFIRGLLSRLDRADADLVFGLMAAEAIDPRKLTASIEEPKRKRLQ